MERTSSRAGQRRSVLLLRVVCCACLLGMIGRSAFSQAPGQNPCDDPWTVCLFKYPDYLGEKLVYTLDPGMRQRAVPILPPDFEDKVSSIKIGANLTIYTFKGRWYGGLPSVSSGSFHATDSGDASISSIVIFPKTYGSPLGAWGWNAYWDLAMVGLGSDAYDHHHFFPAPDMQAPASGFPELGTSDLDKNMNVVATAHEQVSVVMYDGRHYQGAALELPSQDSSWAIIDPDKSYEVAQGNLWGTNLGRYSWSDRAASMVVRWNGPQLGRPLVSRFSLLVGYDLPGKNYKSFPCPNGPAECEKVCESESKCKGFTWVDDPPQCFLKTEVPQQIADKRCISGSRVVPIKLEPPGKKINVQYSENRPGGDYTKFAAKDYQECQTACQNDSRCNAFTWVRPGVQGPTGVCYLKDIVWPAVVNTDTVSGVVEGAPLEPVKDALAQSATGAVLTRAAEMPTFTIERGVDRPGSDLSSFQTDGGHEECQKACEKEAGCVCFTWVQPGVQAPGKAVCWLKSSIPAAVKNRFTVSGVLRPGPPAKR